MITPTRGRPENFDRMVKSCLELSGGNVKIYAGLDLDDPELYNYHKLKYEGTVSLFVEPRKTLSAWTNDLAKYAIEDFGTDKVYLVSMGDDHVVRTNFWNLKLIHAILLLAGPGFSYGDDMMNGSGLCTCWMVSAKLVESVGWMMLPRCNHMYVDNAIIELGEMSDRIRYVSGVKIEHMHPSMKKSDQDVTYQDSELHYIPDLEQFRNWRNSPEFTKVLKTIESLKW